MLVRISAYLPASRDYGSWHHSSVFWFLPFIRVHLRSFAVQISSAVLVFQLRSSALICGKNLPCRIGLSSAFIRVHLR